MLQVIFSGLVFCYLISSRGWCVKNWRNAVMQYGRLYKHSICLLADRI